MWEWSNAWGAGAVRVEIEPPLAVFTICRPEARNALSLEVIEALRRLVEGLSLRPDVLALIIASEGGEAFAAGGDLKQLAALRGEAAGRALSTRVGETLLALESLPLVSLAALEGDAYGGGAELALACDLRIMARSSRLGWTQARFGLTSGWGGGGRLVELIGPARALDVMLNARVLDAERCEVWGLVNRVVDDGEALERCRAMASGISALGRELILGIKHVARAGARLDRGGAVLEEREVFARLWASPAHEAAVAAFLARSNDGD